MPTERRPWEKWFTILDRLEGELKREFPPNSAHDPHIHGKHPGDPGKRLSNEIRAIRSTLRNLKKMEK